MIILEMEDTLVELRASAARSIADVKEMRRAVSRLDELQAGWTDKAELALSKDREDLAQRGARREAEGGRNGRWPARRRWTQIEQVLRSYEADIAQAPGKLARSPRPAERHCGADRKRGGPRQGPRSDARQPHRRMHSPSSSCSSAAQISPKAAPKRWA